MSAAKSRSQMAARNASADGIQERHVGTPDRPHARHQQKDGMVRLPSHSREACARRPKGTLGGRGKAVEVDESYVGGKAKNRAHRKPAPKKAVFTLVERGGEVRTLPVRDVSAKTLGPIIIEDNIDEGSTLMTDEALVYEKIGEEFASHGTVNHQPNEYARAEWFHTNNAENYFRILKRGINGVYHHVSEQHLHRYCAEFDFRYNARKISDAERMHKSVGGIVGKRLTYREA